MPAIVITIQPKNIMQITTVHYSALINLGDYSNEKIGFTARINEDETIDQVIEHLRLKVKEVGGTNAEKFYNTMYEGRRQLAELERKIKRAADEWNATAEFLRTQGIKPEAVDMPRFTNLLPEVKEESSGIFDGELEDESEVVSDGF